MDPPEGVCDDGAGFFVVDDKGHLLAGGLQEQVLVWSAGGKNIDKNGAFLMEMSGTMAGEMAIKNGAFVMEIFKLEEVSYLEGRGFYRGNGVNPCIV